MTLISKVSSQNLTNSGPGAVSVRLEGSLQRQDNAEGFGRYIRMSNGIIAVSSADPLFDGDNHRITFYDADTLNFISQYIGGVSSWGHDWDFAKGKAVRFSSNILIVDSLTASTSTVTYGAGWGDSWVISNVKLLGNVAYVFGTFFTSGVSSIECREVDIFTGEILRTETIPNNAGFLENDVDVEDDQVAFIAPGQANPVRTIPMSTFNMLNSQSGTFNGIKVVNGTQIFFSTVDQRVHIFNTGKWLEPPSDASASYGESFDVDQDLIFVSDRGNNRIVVFQAKAETAVNGAIGKIVKKISCNFSTTSTGTFKVLARRGRLVVSQADEGALGLGAVKVWKYRYDRDYQYDGYRYSPEIGTSGLGRNFGYNMIGEGSSLVVAEPRITNDSDTFGGRIHYYENPLGNVIYNLINSTSRWGAGTNPTSNPPATLTVESPSNNSFNNTGTFFVSMSSRYFCYSDRDETINGLDGTTPDFQIRVYDRRNRSQLFMIRVIESVDHYSADISEKYFVYANRDNVLSNNNPGRLDLHNPNTGAFIRRIQLRADGTGRSSLGRLSANPGLKVWDNMIYAYQQDDLGPTNEDQILYAINGDDGSVLYTIDIGAYHDLGTPVPAIDVSYRYLVVGAGRFDIPGDTVTQRGRVYVYDRSDGTLLYSIDSPGNKNSTSVFNGYSFGVKVSCDDEYLIVSAEGTDLRGETYIFDIKDGKLLQQIDAWSSFRPAFDQWYRNALTKYHLYIGGPFMDYGSTNSVGRIYQYELPTRSF